MKRTAYIISSFLMVISTVVATTAQSSDRADGMRFVPDVVNQVFYLTQYAEPLGLNLGTSPNPSTCRHYQSIVRSEANDGTPYFFVTRSGNTPFPPGEIGCDDSPGETRNGHFVVFKMGSRDKDGERLRSNRMASGSHADNTAPSSLDRATAYFTFVGGNPNDPDPAKRPGMIPGDGPDGLPARVYQHPGGMQMVGKMLAVALETPRQTGRQSDLVACGLGDVDACIRYFGYEKATEPTAIQFYDMSNPEAPLFRSQFIPKNSAGQTVSVAGVVGITPLKNGKYLMVITGGSDNLSWFFYRSTGTDLSSPSLSWEQVRTPVAPQTADAHQTLNFLREGDIDGDLYLAAARGHIGVGPFFQDRERIDLYKIDCVNDNCEPGEDIEITTVVNGKRVSPFSAANGFDQQVSLAAGSSFYVSPSGEVIFYATEHDNDGPNETMKMGEWRYVEVVRPNSPTLLPSAKINGPFEVDEGSSINLTGSGKQPATKAFIQLFNDVDYGPKYFIADYEDRNKDDFDNLFGYERTFFRTFADVAQSWGWFAPPGCSIQAIDRVNEDTEEVDEMKTLTGATSTQADPDLSVVMHDGGTDDIDQEIDRIKFGSDCDDYYSAPIGLYWDLDRDGSFEAQGNSVNFSAATLDGPTDLQVPVEARHPSGGSPGMASTRVRILNVAPQFTHFDMRDSAGNPVNTTVPWVLTGLPVSVAGSFTDPGIPDRQIAYVSWGDGSPTESNTDFDAFDEAFGDGVGSLSQSHVFTAPGTYLVETLVADDDGDFDYKSVSVLVLTPEQAVMQLIQMIDAAIAATSDAGIRASLQHARVALAGSNDNSQNGALQMVRAGNNLAAAAFAQTSVTWLQRAAEDGADVGLMISLLQQLSAALGA